MKTTKNFPVLGLALIFFAATFASSASFAKKPGNTSIQPPITYQVTVNVSLDSKLCNVYLVKIVDKNGHLAAPAQRFEPGVAKYTFNEGGPAFGVRMAILVQAPSHGHFACETELYTTPVVLNGPFKGGETYRFDLYPKIESTTKD